MLKKVETPRFGTDGIRGRAVDFDLEGITRMGQYIAQGLPRGSTYVIGKDPRKFGPEFEQALRKGIHSSNRGIRVEYVDGPTPLLSYIIAHSEIQGGAMITASHNPAHYNGIKFFDENGRKIPDPLEARLESTYLNSDLHILNPQTAEVVPFENQSDDLKEEYITQMRRILEESSLQGSVAIDCANGATSKIAKEIFKRTRRGLEFELFANQPDGYNINKGCGVTNPQFLEERIREGNFNLGISFDGDGDRVGFVDELGRKIDGDFVLAYLATKLKEEGRLKGGGIVVTEYSNLALDTYLQRRGIEVQRVLNGDKAVMEKLRANGLNFGGENSGHIILDTSLGCGDGIRAAVEMLKYLDPSIPMSEQFDLYTPNPQIQRSIEVTNPQDILKYLEEPIESIRQELERKGGRLLIRASGTEPKIRILTEAEDERLMRDFQGEVVSLINEKIREIEDNDKKRDFDYWG